MFGRLLGKELLGGLLGKELFKRTAGEETPCHRPLTDPSPFHTESPFPNRRQNAGHHVILGKALVIA